MKRKGTTPAREWTPFKRATSATHRVTGDSVPIEDGWELWFNNQYTVHLRRSVDQGGRLPDLVHLSIKRKDRKTARDWRHLQRIKNELVGPECEGVEVYPAESRLVDTSNQYHLWVFADPEFRIPWGFGERLVMTPEDVAASPIDSGAVQRPFEESV